MNSFMFLRCLSQKNISLKKIYETKIIPPLKRKKLTRSNGPIRTVFELYKESKLPFYQRAPYLRKKKKLDTKFLEFIKKREKNAFSLYKERGQIRIHTKLTRSSEMDGGWFSFVPPNPITEDMSKFLYEDRERYEKFINDGTYDYPCCEEFSKVPIRCEFFRERKPGRSGNKVIDNFFKKDNLLIQPKNAQNMSPKSRFTKKHKK